MGTAMSEGLCRITKVFDSAGHVPEDAGNGSGDLRSVYLFKLLLGLSR